MSTPSLMMTVLTLASWPFDLSNYYKRILKGAKIYCNYKSQQRDNIRSYIPKNTAGSLHKILNVALTSSESK